MSKKLHPTDQIKYLVDSEGLFGKKISLPMKLPQTADLKSLFSEEYQEIRN